MGKVRPVRLLFSSFPNGLPGTALLLLRLALVGGLVADAMGRFREPDFSQQLPAVGAILAAALLLIGLWTSVVAMLTCMLELGLVPLSHGMIEPQLLQAAIALGLSVLGPGIWSLDARLFGRRRIEIKNLSDN
jgi:putative oxidoreductase